MRKTVLREAIRRGLRRYGVAGVGLAFASTALPVLAQDSSPAGQKLETITVTGSRIRKADVETAQPIVVLDRATIEHQGFNSVADILQNLTEAGTPPISRSSVLASGEDVGGYYIDLRNLGNNRTLVLLNGKRLGATTGGSQDLSQVPMAAIERIEVLKDGASAIYGSDAIAGVVNIITRKNYDGAEASAYVGQYDEDDGAKQTYSMTLGARSDRGSITLATEYSKEDPVWAKNRPYSRYGATDRHPEDELTVVSQWGAFFVPFCPDGMCTLNPGGNPLNIGLNGGPNDWHDTNGAGGTSDLTNSNEEMMLSTSIERKALFVSADYALTDDIKFSTDLLYNKRSTLQQVAGYPGQFTGRKPGKPNLDPMSPYSYYNPMGFWHNPDFDPDNADDYAIYGYRRGWEVPRTTQNDLQTYRFSGTLEGSFDIGEHDWHWDVGGYVNQNDLLKTARGDYSLLAASQALGPSFLDPETGLVTCGTPDHPATYGSTPGACIPWNFLIPAGTTGDGALQGNAGLQALLFPTYHDTGKTRSVDYSANITGSIFTLPAGDVGVAAGYEHRNESGAFEPDAFSQSAQSTNLASGPTGGRYSVDEYYLEVDVPILKDIPFFKELSVNLAGRYSDYTTFGNTTNGKFSLTWKPIDDLMVRGNYAQGFRAPTISDLYGGIGGTFDYYTDPCDVSGGAAATNPAVEARCRAGVPGQPGVPADFHQPNQSGRPCSTFPCQSGVMTFAGSNPNLIPETATSKTLGVVYSPGWVQGLDLSLDWFRIHIKNAIASDTMSAMLKDCYVLGVDSRCDPTLFMRDPTTGAVTYALRAGVNRGWIDTEGYDLGVNYRLPEFSFGRFALHWNTTYVSHLDVKPDNAPTTPVSPNTGYEGNFRIRSNLGLDWNLGDFGATWTTRYYSGIKEDCSYDAPPEFPEGGPECNMPYHVAPDTGPNPLNRTGANAFHDVQVRWNAPWNATISLGANNVFDHVGPYLYSAPNSQYSYYGGFDIGRFYYVRYNQKF